MQRHPASSVPTTESAGIEQEGPEPVEPDQGLSCVGVAGFEPTTSSSRTTPPGVLMTLGTLARVSFPSSAALGGLARAGVAKIYCGLPAD